MSDRTRFARLCRAGSTAFAALWLAAAPAWAGVTTDGSTGTKGAVTLTGPNYVIGADLGTRSGKNLFDSFSEFSLAKGQSATFTGPSNVDNIVARVTGGDASAIDGTIATKTGGHPNVYLINPHGVIFGADGSLNVEGSFHVSTADYLKFADGAKLQTKLGKGSSFSSAAPAAFGFLSSKPAAIAVSGAKLSVASGRSLDFVAGAVRITDGHVCAPAGTIRVTSAAAAGEVPVASVNDRGSTVKTLGSVWIGDGSSLDVGNNGSHRTGGKLLVNAGRLTLDHADLSAGGNSSGAGGSIALSGSRSVAIEDGTSVSSVAEGTGRGADIRLTGGRITVDHNSRVLTDAAGSGQGGSIAVRGHAVTLRNGAELAAIDHGNGKGGALTLAAASLAVSGAAQDVGIPNLGSVAFGSGDAGAVAISTRGGIAIEAGAIVGTATYGGGDAGALSIRASALDIRGGQSPERTGLIAESGNGATGEAGQITVSAGNIALTGTGGISSTTYGTGNGGNISIESSGNIEIRGLAKLTEKGEDEPITTGFSSTAGIFSESRSTQAETGKAGNIAIDAPTIRIAATGEVSSSTFGTGGAGNITIDTHGGALTIVAPSNLRSYTKTVAPTGIFSQSQSLAGPGYATIPGNAGQITIETGSMKIRGSGEISSGAYVRTQLTSGPPVDAVVTSGSIDITASGLLEIDGAPSPPNIGYAQVMGGIFANSNSLGLASISGSITIDAGALRLSDSGSIASGTFLNGFAHDGLAGLKDGGISIIVQGGLEIDSGGAIGTSFALNISGPDSVIDYAGNVDIDAHLISLKHGSIYSGGYNDGGGNVTITSGTHMEIDNSEVSAAAEEGFALHGIIIGDKQLSGSVKVKAASIGIAGMGEIYSDREVTVRTPGLLSIRGSARAAGKAGQAGVSAGIFAETNGYSPYHVSCECKGGGLDIHAGSITITQNGALGADGFSDIQGGGDLTVHANTITLTGDSVISANSGGGNVDITGQTVTIDHSSVSTTAASDHGGNINVDLTGFLYINHGSISSSAIAGAFDGGNVTTRSSALVLDKGQMSANADAGAGGNMLVSAEALIQTPGSSITASSATGVNGTVVVSALVNDVTASLAELSGKLSSTDHVSHMACGTSGHGGPGQSSLIIRGGGALPYDGDGPKTAFYTAPLIVSAKPVAYGAGGILPCR